MKAVLVIIGILLLLDVSFLNWKTFSQNKQDFLPIKTESEKDDTCPEACVALIPSPAKVEVKIIPTPAPIPAKRTREYYIPLGSGISSNSNWEFITGAEAVIDMASYPNPVAVVFEASLSIPTGNGEVFAKLYNITDKHDAWLSEVKVASPTSQRAEAIDIVLEPGKKLYRVMMKSSMGYEAVLSSARIKIILSE